MSNIKSIVFQVRGRVQGVFFRQSTVDTAVELGISGWVQNNSDGSVSGFASGSAHALQQFQGWLNHGPAQARVDNVQWREADAAEIPAERLNGFSIRRV